VTDERKVKELAKSLYDNHLVKDMNDAIDKARAILEQSESMNS